MKNMRILIDTNILVDYLQKRTPFNLSAERIVDLSTDNVIEGCIAAHTITNLFYILRKIYTIEERKEILLGFCKLFDVIDIDTTKLINALKDERFSDFEDCLQMECAKNASVDYIVTRNLEDFKNSDIPVLSSEEFISLLKE